jgi:hypothetical protein
LHKPSHRCFDLTKKATSSILQNKEKERKEAAEHAAAAAAARMDIAAGMNRSKKGDVEKEQKQKINQHTEEAENRSKKGDVEKEQKQKITEMAEEAKQDPDKKSRREVLETQVADDLAWIVKEIGKESPRRV